MADFDPASRLDKSYVAKIKGASDEARKRRKSLERESEKQKLKNERWAGVKDGMIEVLSKLDPNGAHCEKCGKPGTRDTLELHHIGRQRLVQKRVAS